MPPWVKSRYAPPLNGLKLRTNASSPEPVATTHACAAADAAVAVPRCAAEADCAANVVRRTTAPKAPSARSVLRAERAELSMLRSFLHRPASVGRSVIESG